MAGSLVAAAIVAAPVDSWSQRRDVASTAGAEASAQQGPRGAGILARAWPAYRKAFIREDGRVVDNGNGGISHSEGQGYAMVLAAAVQDRDSFARLWRWTSRELYIRDDGLAAWKWEPRASPNVTDRNNASDGDLLIAWALAEAGARWEEPGYTTAARTIAGAIFKHNVSASRFGPILLPGAVGFSASEQPDGPVVNLSYWIFPALERMAILVPGHDWAGLRASGLALIRDSRFGPLRLPPEWLAIGGKAPVPATNFERRFGYNAVRIPLYLAWSQRAQADQLKPFLTMWNATENLGPFIVDIDDGKASGNLDAPGYRMIFALAQCVAGGRSVPFELATGRNDLYYPATLALLSTLAISERRPQCL